MVNPWDEKAHKKGVATGVMTSAFVDAERGFALPMSEEELRDVNIKRVEEGKVILQSSPALRFFEYGKNREGYWNYDLFSQQVTDFLDCAESIYPNRQLLIEVDRSSGHMKYADDSLFKLGWETNT